MLKSHFNKIQAIFLIVFSIFLFISIVYSSNPFQTPKTCSNTWGSSCDSTSLDDARDPCNGTQTSTSEYVKEVYINASSFFPNDIINVTCEFQENSGLGGSTTDEEYVYYYNTTTWMRIKKWTGETGNVVNKSVAFQVNETEGTHWVRCIILLGDTDFPELDTTEYCANGTTVGTGDYDNDDINFTVTTRLTYDFWNLTNYTTGEEIASGQTYTRDDRINVSAHWNKNISYALVEHNGTGTWTNYTISSFTGNWTNYTLNLSNRSEFNAKTIGIRAIYVNDTTSAENYTSPLLHFKLNLVEPQWVEGTNYTSATCAACNVEFRLNWTDTEELSGYIFSIINGTEFSTETVETGSSGGHSSIALDSNENVHISHSNVTGGILRYCNNTLGSWNCEEISGTDNVQHTSIAMDSNDKVHICYYDASDRDLEYCNNTNGWSCGTIEDEGRMGEFCSIAIDSNDDVHISHRNLTDINNNQLRYCNNTGGSWNCINPGNAGCSKFTSLAIDSNDVVHIIYGHAYLSYVNSSVWTSAVNIENAKTASYGSIAIDSNNVPHIAAYVDENGIYYYNRTVLPPPDTAWYSTLISTEQYDVSLALDSDDLPHISFLNSSSNSLSYCYTTNFTTWSCKDIDGTGGRYHVYNRGIATKKGRLSDSTSFSTNVHISYTNITTSNLMYAERGWQNQTWTSFPASNWSNYTVGITYEGNANISWKYYANDTDNMWNVSDVFSFLTAVRGDPPIVANFWFTYLGDTTNNTNVFTNFTIHANVSDDIGLSNVFVDLTYPGGLNKNLSMDISTSSGWQIANYTFNTSQQAQYPLNETGNYTVRIIARDRGGQENVSGNYNSYPASMNFSVYNTYTLNLTSDHSTYMRGENITIQALDVNNNTVNVTWNVNITKINVTYNYSIQATTFNYTVLSNDTAGNYTVLVVNATKNENFGNQSWDLNVSSTFTLNFSQPAANTQYGTNGIIDTPKVGVYNARDEFLNSVKVSLQCPNGWFNLTLSGQQYYNESAVCRASTSAGVTFQITANASDAYNNSGEVSLDLRTQSSGDGTTSSGGGGGGGGVVQNVTIINATSNATGFNFTLSSSEIQIYRGEDATIVGALSNEGDTNLTVSSSIFLNSTCCVVTLDPSEFILEVGGAEVPFTISIHVNTTTEPDTEHFADITLKSGTLEKSKRIKIIVKENPVISSLDQVTGQISEAEAKIIEYVKAGIDVGFLQNLLNQIKGKKTDSASAMEGDDINRLKQYDDFIQSSLKQINDELNKLAFLKMIYENKWNIVTGMAIGLVSTYLVTLIMIPYFRIEFEIRKLLLERASLAKSRVVTTKSYFLRKIDEKTFRSIITDRQGKIYKLKSMIELKQQAKSDLVRERLNPLYGVKLIKQKITKIRSKKKKAS